MISKAYMRCVVAIIFLMFYTGDPDPTLVPTHTIIDEVTSCLLNHFIESTKFGWQINVSTNYLFQ